MTQLKIGNAHDETGKKFFASEYLSESTQGLFWGDSLIFNTDNFSVGTGITGDGSIANPFDWKGFSSQNSSGVLLASNLKTIKTGSGLQTSSSNGVFTIAVDISNYSANAIALTGGGTKLVLNGGWSLQDGNAVKLASENAYTAYLYSSDANQEYPVLKVKSNAGGSDRKYLLLNSSGKVPVEARPIATSSAIGEIMVNGNSLSIDAAGLLRWTGFMALNSSGSNLSSEIKTLQAGNHIIFTASGGVLTIAASGSDITIDASLSSTSTNPVQNKAVYAALEKKLTPPTGGTAGQILGKTASGYAWLDQTTGSSVTIDSILSNTSENPVQNKIIYAALAEKLTTPAGGTAGQVLGKTASGFAWINQTGGSGTVDISKILLQRPISDYDLYPKIEASESADFSTVVTLDPRNTAADREYFRIFDGEIWMDFPTESGLGTPFEGMSLYADTGKFAALTQPYYLRYCWITEDGAESNYKSIVFPSVQTPSPIQSGSGESNLPEPTFNDVGKIPVVAGLESPHYELREIAAENAGIDKLLLQRPISDEELYPKVTASNEADFTNAVVLNPYSTALHKNFIKVYTGSEWINFPSEGGLGTPFDGMAISINTSFFSTLTQPFYLQFCWVNSEGIESNKKSTIFPSVQTPSPSVPENGKFSVPTDILEDDSAITPEKNSQVTPFFRLTDDGATEIAVKKSDGSTEAISSQKNGSDIRIGFITQVNLNGTVDARAVKIVDGIWDWDGNVLQGLYCDWRNPDVLSDPPEPPCPSDLTSNDSNERWLVSANTSETLSVDKSTAYKAFDGDSNTKVEFKGALYDGMEAWASIDFVCRDARIVVKQIDFTGYSSSGITASPGVWTTPVVSASDDGITWTELGRTSGGWGASGSVTFAKNSQSYKRYRITFYFGAYSGTDTGYYHVSSITAFSSIQ